MDSKKKNGMNDKSRFTYLMYFIVPLVLIAIIVPGYFYIKSKHISFKMFNEEAEKHSESITSSVNPLYYQMDAFTLNLISPDQKSSRVLYIGLTLKLNDEESRKNTKIFLPEIRSRLLVLFSQQNSGDLLTIEGKNQLATKAKDLINLPIAGQQRVYVTDVLFNAFILR